MKKSILVLSALLTLVVSGVCLQSCSSEYDEYTTEEYGYYTEEEIAAIEALAEKYDIDAEVDKNYYGQKVSLRDLEERFISIMFLPGDYELKKDGNNGLFYFRKKGNDANRAKTRSVEARLPQVGETTITSSITPCAFYLSWRLATKRYPAEAHISVLDPYYLLGGDGVIGNEDITDYSISIFQTYTICTQGVSCGRYNISGTYYANGTKDFKITKIPE
ncbi:MAG: hypothetical protein IJE15_07200 [Bacteroidaceae bacterium]|nr:hypothetical protein [Bacteroidaceae bacterium]